MTLQHGPSSRPCQLGDPGHRPELARTVFATVSRAQPGRAQQARGIVAGSQASSRRAGPTRRRRRHDSEALRRDQVLTPLNCRANPRSASSSSADAAAAQSDAGSHALGVHQSKVLCGSLSLVPVVPARTVQIRSLRLEGHWYLCMLTLCQAQLAFERAPNKVFTEISLKD